MRPWLALVSVPFGSPMTDSPGTSYERSDVDPVLVGWLALGLGLFIVATPLLMPFAFSRSIDRGNPAARPALSAEAPPLALDPAAELRRHREADRQFADSYGWIDRGRGVVRIPVRRAMERLLETGLPGWSSR